MVGLALKARPSVDFCGYGQRPVAEATPFEVASTWEHMFHHMSTRVYGILIRKRLHSLAIMGTKPMSRKGIAMSQQQEVDRNYEEFQKLLPSILSTHRNQYALMQDGKVIGYYSTSRDAVITANNFLSGKPYSIQRVTDGKVDLGFFSHAVHIGSI